MSNIPENQKNNGMDNEEVFSTIFSNPEEHREINNPKKPLKPFVKIIAFFLSLAVLIGSTIAVIEFIPEREEGSDAPVIKETEILNLDADTFKEVIINNTNGEIKLYSQEVKNTDSSDENATLIEWYLDGYDKSLVSSSLAAEKLEMLCYINAIRKIEKKTNAECGLDKPTATAEIIISDEERLTISLGNASPDKTGYYLKLSDREDIYLVSEEVKENLEFSVLDLAVADTIAGIPLDENMSDYKDENGVLSSFDTITLSGKNLKTPVVIAPNNDQVVLYKTISPMVRKAQNVDDIFNAFKSGLTASGAYSFNTDANSLKEFGLDNPDFTMTMKAGKITHTFKFSLQEDGDYAAIRTDGKLIKRISADYLSFIGFNVTDFYSNWVCLEYMNSLSGMKFKTNNTSYDFTLKTTEKEDEKAETSVTYNGNAIDIDEFTKLYEYCISLTCSDFEVEETTDSAELTIIFELADGSNKTYEFIKSGATKYQYRENSVDMGKVNSSALNKVLSELENLVK